VQAQKGKQGETPMALSILNNISSLTAENALSNTQASLQKTLTQLSTGMKINSGSDDAAGLSIAEGMTANMAALTQSQQNASNGIGMLQTADGALSQVTSLLNRAVTLATEAASSNITGSQSTALNTEFQAILSEVNQIGQTTNFNGLNVFSGNTGTDFGTTSGTTLKPLTTASTLAIGSVTTITDAADNSTFSFTATAAAHAISDLNTAISTAKTAAGASAGKVLSAAFAVGAAVQGTANAVDTNNLELTDGGDSLTVTTSDTTTLASIGVVGGNANQSDVFLSDGSTVASAANTQITTNINALSSAALGLSKNDLQSASTATAALTAVNNAITQVSANRGVIGAAVNRLTAASGDMSSEVTNLQSATNSIQNADIGKTVANMTQYNVLQSTGMAALQQSNQAQQAVLKLVQ
jgi:flagellin